MRLKEAAETKAELEAAAARLPGPEAAVQLALYQVGSASFLDLVVHRPPNMCDGHGRSTSTAATVVQLATD